MRWLTVVALAFCARSDPVTEVFDELEVLQAHSVVAAAKQAKRELDDMRKAHDVALADIDEMRRVIAEDSAGLTELEQAVDLAHVEGVGAIADYSKLVVFMQRCDDGFCLDEALNTTEAQLTALLSATATEHASALESKVETLVDESVRLKAALAKVRAEQSALEERCDDEVYRLLQEVDRHESGEKKEKQRGEKSREGQDRRDADKKQLEDEVKELQKHKAWECGVMSTHDDLPAREGSYAIVRLYDPPKSKGKLWWTLAEVLRVIEGDGIAPSSLLEVRLFKEEIKYVSNFALNSPFDRDLSDKGLVRLRRDAFAYIDVKLSGAGDVSAGRDPAAGNAAAWTAARAANSTEDDDKEKTKEARGAFRPPKEIDTEKDKEEKAKMSSRKAGTRIAEVEKRAIVARLKADEAEWKKRDLTKNHEKAAMEVGKYVAWHYSPDGKPGELWFRFGLIEDVVGEKLKDDKKGKNTNRNVNLTVRVFDPPLRYPLNESHIKGKFRVLGDVDDPAKALEDLERKARSDHKRDMKKKKKDGKKVDAVEAERELNETIANLALPPPSNETWDLDPGGEPVPGERSLVVIPRTKVAYADLQLSETKARGGLAATYTLKSHGKGDVENVLEQATGKWWRALADEWRQDLESCAAAAGPAKKDSKFDGPVKGRGVKPKEEKPPGADLNVTVGGNLISEPYNVTQEDVAAAIATAYLDRLRNKTEVLESVDARLEALHRKLEWLARARNESLLSEADALAQKDAVLAEFRAVEAGAPS